jgi:TfoX/Sxy family transcriptional regulator of competence genes
VSETSGGEGRADHRELLARLQHIAPALPFPLTSRPMFGGTMAYADGRPFASLSSAGLAVKLPAGDQRRLLDERGGRRLRHAPDQPGSKQYIVLPRRIVDDDDALAEWVGLSGRHAMGGRR